jgi:hypothetical protein
VAIGQAWCMRAATYPELRVRLPDDSPAVERLTQALMDGDRPGSRAPFEEVLQEIDTPVERARLVRAVHALMDDGVVDVIEAAVAAFELSTVSRELLRAWLMDAMDARIKRAGHRHERRTGLQRQQRTRTRRSHPPQRPSSG